MKLMTGWGSGPYSRPEPPRIICTELDGLRNGQVIERWISDPVELEGHAILHEQHVLAFLRIAQAAVGQVELGRILLLGEHDARQPVEDLALVVVNHVGCLSNFTTEVFLVTVMVAPSTSGACARSGSHG